MLSLLLNIKFENIKKNFNSEDIKAGIIFDAEGNAIDKLMFEEVNGVAVNVFNGECFSFDEADDYYVSNIVSLEKLLKNFFGGSTLTFYQVFMAYKMFLNDANFLNRHLDYFGMFVRPVGYKEKYEIAKDPSSFNIAGQELYYLLMNIIFYKNINSEKINESVKTR